MTNSIGLPFTPPALLTSSIAMVIPIRYIVPLGVRSPESGRLAPILTGGFSAANNAELAITPVSTAHPAVNLRLFIRTILPCSSEPKIQVEQLSVAGKHVGVALLNDHTLPKHVTAMSETQGGVDVLLNKQDCHSTGLDATQDTICLAHHPWGQPE